MKLLYIVPKIKNTGGVARVLAIKANYFVNNYGYQVHIISQNENDVKPFYTFDNKIIFNNINLKGSGFSFLFSLYKAINQQIKKINPDVILVADNGLKAFIYPFIIDRKIPIVFECHGSKFIEEKDPKENLFLKLKYHFKNFGASKFTKMVALSNESLNEWKVKNAVVIPNPSWITSDLTALLESKKTIAIARNSYEKGLDRLLIIWGKISQKYPQWTLDIYTDDIVSLEKEASNLGIKSNINYFNFVKNIEQKYLEAAICLMTSRSEGFPMVLLEAMTLGLPCIAYDCPSGLSSIIKNEKNGFLIPDGNIELFIEKLSYLIENEEERVKFGTNAKEFSKSFNVDEIMKDWKLLLENLIK